MLTAYAPRACQIKMALKKRSRPGPSRNGVLGDATRQLIRIGDVDVRCADRGVVGSVRLAARS